MGLFGGRVVGLVALMFALLATTASAQISFKRSDTNLAYLPQDVAIANLDGRRGPDMVIADETNGSVHVYLNRGNGTFKPPVSKSACGGAREVVIGKLNAGSAPDLLVDCGGGNYGAVTLLGNGSGGFHAAKDAGAAGGAGSLSLGYINTAAGGLDVAFDGFGTFGSILCVGTGNGNGTFRQGRYCAQDPLDLHYQAVYGPIAVADISGDRKAEMMTFTQHAGDGTVAFFHWNLAAFPQGGIVPNPSFRRTGAGFGLAIKAVDLDRDGDRDIVTGHYDGKIGVFKWGAKGILPSVTAKLYRAGPGLDDMALGHFNGDHKLDAASVTTSPPDSRHPASGSIQINTGNGNATFDTPSRKFPAGLNGGTHRLAIGDLNRDGRADIAVVELHGKLSMLLSK